MDLSRQTRLQIDLGKEQVSIRRLEASEALGRPFSISIDIVAAHGEIDLLPHLGKPVSVALYEDRELQRYFHGVLTEGEFLNLAHDGLRYRLSLRPWTYLMAHGKDYAIYQDKSAIDIAREIFGKYPLAKVDYGKLNSHPKPRTYCVQYGESDFVFVTRILEEEGIYYFYEHGADEHRMVLCDGPPSHHKAKPGLLEYNPDVGSVANAGSADRASTGQRQDFITAWREHVSTGGEAKVTLRDFNFEHAERYVESDATMSVDHPADSNEVYDWPGLYGEKTEGTKISERTLKALRANRRCFTGETQSLAIACGRKFMLKFHPSPRFKDKDYLITRTHHVTSIEHERSGGQADNSTVFIEVVPAETEWQLIPTVPRPVVKGPETAVVTGPSREEIFTDKYGRVKVRFHWDRASTPDESSTCWIRVSQTGGLGNMILPRVGHEVIVDFLNGNPDRPIVVGRVYNSVNMPVYDLPDNKTRAVWRTKTYKSDSSSTFPGAESMDVDDPRANELRFEDMAGKEEVFLHAERDMKTRIRYKESHHVGLDQEIKIGQNRTEHVKKNDTIEIHGARKTEIKQSEALDVKRNIKIDSGSEIAISAVSKITLTVGGSSITIEPTGIKIVGTAMLEAKSPLTTVKGDAMLTLKGGITMIN